MKKIIMSFLTICLFSGVYLNATEDKKVEPNRTPAEYEKIIEKIKNIANNIDSLDFYKELKIYSKIEEKDLSINDLSKFHQKILILEHIERFDGNLNVFIKDLESKIEFEEDLDKLERSEAKDKPSQSGDIYDVLIKVKEIKLKFLDKYEDFIKTFFEENKLYFKKQELKMYLDKIKKNRESLNND